MTFYIPQFWLGMICLGLAQVVILVGLAIFSPKDKKKIKP